MNMPRFTAASSLSRVVAPADVPGGPGNVPVGYNRECQYLPYWICDASGCRVEYYWYCTYKPIAR